MVCAIFFFFFLGSLFIVLEKLNMFKNNFPPSHAFSSYYKLSCFPVGRVPMSELVADNLVMSQNAKKWNLINWELIFT